MPLFAFAIMQFEIPGYAYTQFIDDLRIRKIKPKKTKISSPLKRYGRYAEMLRQLEAYKQTENVLFGLKAQQLRKDMTKPYRVIIQKNGKSHEYNLSPFVPYQTVSKLVKELTSFSNLDQAEQYFLEFKQHSHIL